MEQIMKNTIIVVLSGIGMLISCHLSKTSTAAPDAEPQFFVSHPYAYRLYS